MSSAGERFEREVLLEAEKVLYLATETHPGMINDHVFFLFFLGAVGERHNPLGAQ